MYRLIVLGVHQNMYSLNPLHHLALQVATLELGTSPLRKFTRQQQNSLRTIRLGKVRLEQCIGEGFMMDPSWL